MTDLHVQVGEHEARITDIKDDIREIKENQRVVLEFIAEQKAGRKYVWIFLAAIAGAATFFKDIASLVYSLFHLK